MFIFRDFFTPKVEIYSKKAISIYHYLCFYIHDGYYLHQNGLCLHVYFFFLGRKREFKCLSKFLCDSKQKKIEKNLLKLKYISSQLMRLDKRGFNYIFLPIRLKDLALKFSK